MWAGRKQQMAGNDVTACSVRASLTCGLLLGYRAPRLPSFQSSTLGLPRRLFGWPSCHSLLQHRRTRRWVSWVPIPFRLPPFALFLPSQGPLPSMSTYVFPQCSSSACRGGGHVKISNDSIKTVH